MNADRSPLPTREEIRAEMGIPSVGLDVRGQKDTVGFASSAEQMRRVVTLAASTEKSSEERPKETKPAPAHGTSPAWGAICPHDDYLYAGRSYHILLPSIQARTVVLIGVFHRYRRFECRERLIFDPYRAWRTPDGEVSVSTLRDRWLEALDPSDYLRDERMHDLEHSIEAIVYWLRHERPDREIVPLLVPAMSFPRLCALAERAAATLAVSGPLSAAGRTPTSDARLESQLAIVISADAVHYGADFRHTPYGAGGVDAYDCATARDRAILDEQIAGPITVDRARTLYETFVDPERPDDYRVTWCGRFSIPFGLLFARALSRHLGGLDVEAEVVNYATSLSSPPLRVLDFGMGATAPATLEHFVGYPGVLLRRIPGATLESGVESVAVTDPM